MILGIGIAGLNRSEWSCAMIPAYMRPNIRRKLSDVLAIDGFREDADVIRHARKTGVCLSICMNDHCYNAIKGPSNQTHGHCDWCDAHTMVSLQVLAGIVAKYHYGRINVLLRLLKDRIKWRR